MKKSTPLMPAAFLLIIAAASSQALIKDSDWPMQYHDITHTGYSNASSELYIENISRLYTYEAGGDLSSPIAADIDDDNKTEIVFGSQDKSLYVLDSKAELLWTYKTEGSVFTPGAYDIYDNNKTEILFGSGDGRIHLLDSKGNKIWEYAANGSIKGSPIALNLDRWPQKEIVAASADKYLYVIDYAGRKLRSYQIFDAPASMPSAGDINGDKKTDLLVGSENNRVDIIGYPGLVRWTYKTHDAVTGALTYDYNKDGKEEVILSSADGGIYGLHYGEQASNASVNKCDSKGICVNEPVKIAVLAKDWEYKTDGEIVSVPAIADIDQDNATEIIVGSRDKSLYILNSSGGVERRYSINGRILSSPAVADLDGDGNAETVFGADDGFMYVINSTGYAKWSYKTNAPITQSPAVADINSDGNLEILAVSGNRLYIFGSAQEEKTKASTTTTTTTTTTTITTTASTTSTTNAVTTILPISPAAAASTTTTHSAPTTLIAKETVDVTPLNFLLFLSEFFLIAALAFVALDAFRDKFMKKKSTPQKAREEQDKEPAPDAYEKPRPAKEDPYKEDMEKVIYGVNRGEDTDLSNPQH